MKAASGAAVLLAACLVVTGCSRSDREYYPTAPGTRWQYRLWGKAQEGRNPELTLDALTYTSTALPPRDLNGQSVIPYLGELDGRLMTGFVTTGANGIYTVAYQALGKQEITALEEPSCVLRFPLRIGMTCQINRPEQLGKLTFQMAGTQRTDAVDDTVSVPAGTYPHCVRVSAEMIGSALLPDLPGQARLETKIIEWYAPGVGLVKQISWEVAEPISLGWGTRTMELIAYEE